MSLSARSLADGVPAVALPPLPSQPQGTAWPGAEWPTGSLSAATDAERLGALLDDAFSDAGRARLSETHAFLVIEGGRLVLERYAGGQWTAQSTYPSWSMAKSITQALAGFLWAEGRLDPNAPINAPEWRNAGDRRSHLTFAQLLRMSSGLEFVEEYVQGNKSDVIEMLFGSGKDDVAHYAASLPLIHKPNTHFNYASGTTNILARAIGTIVGGGENGMRDFMQRRLFGPLGITSAVPKFDAAGTFIGSSYCFMTARDFARFGLLYLRGGVWNGAELLPHAWIDDARTPTPWVPDTEPMGYGSHWWLGLGGPGSFSANGYGGQYIVCVPQHDLIVVRHGDSIGDFRDPVRDFMRATISCFG